MLLLVHSAVRRAGLEMIIRERPELKLVGSLHEDSHLARHIVTLSPDVVLQDCEVDDRWVKDIGLPSVIPVEDPSSGALAEALRHGTRAILPRDVPLETLASGIMSAYRGLVLLHGSYAVKLLASSAVVSADELGITEELTTRELEVLRMLAEGLGNRDIGKALGISDHTVKFHIGAIFEKLGASTRTEAVMIGVRMGLILL